MGPIAPACFLPETFASQDQNLFSPLAEYAILATIHGRVQSHYQSSAVERAHKTATQDLWSRHEWIDVVLTQTAQRLSLSHTTLPIDPDPTQLLCHMTVSMIRICLCKVIDPFAYDYAYGSKVKEYQERAMEAAQSIAQLTKEQSQSGLFKVCYAIKFATFSDVIM